MQTTDPLIGQTLAQYQISALLGGGGMGKVYRARHLTTRREVALKVIQVAEAPSSAHIERFKREAEAVAALEHPHIIALYDYGQEDGREGPVIYMAMALKTGGSLADVIKHERLSLNDIQRFLDQVASALDYAHSRGVIHRDLKPANVLLDEDRNCFLSDFGIARRLGQTKLTAEGMAVGSPLYMAPEAWRAEEPSAETDVYSLGVILYELLTGQPPYIERNATRLMLKHLSEPIPSLLVQRGDLSEYVDIVVRQALAKDRAERCRTAGELALRFKVAAQMPTITLDDAPEAHDSATSVNKPTQLRVHVNEAKRRTATPVDTDPMGPQKTLKAVEGGQALPAWVLPTVGVGAFIVLFMLFVLLSRG